MADHRQRARKAGVSAPPDRAARRAEARQKRKEEPAGESRATAILRRHAVSLILWAMIAIFARYYFWSVWPRSEPVRGLGLFAALTDAFEHGQASFRFTPQPQLLALPDPYEPEQNARYRVHDASLYNGRYYLYFGPAPVIFVYLPYKLVTGDFLPDRLGTWVFAVAAYAAGCFLLKLLVEQWWPGSPRWLLYFLCGCLGFSNAFPFLLRRPAIYETAIAAGQFFVLLALYAIARSALGRAHSLWMAAVGGAALAAAFGSRPQMILAGAALGWFLILDPQAPLRARIERLAAAAGPLAAGMGLLLYYNYRRFGSLFEFGNHYQLAAVNVRKMQLFSISRMFVNLWFSALEPPRVRARFPFVVLAPNPPFRLPKDFSGLEVVAGMVWLAPLVVLLAATPWLLRRMEPVRRTAWAVCTATLVALGGAWMAVDGTLGSTMRYQADFAAVLFLAAATTAAGLSEVAGPRAKAWLLRAIVALGLCGVVVNGATGLTGYYDNFRQEAPAQYQSLADWFTPVAKLLAWCGVPPDRTPAPQVNLN